MKIVSVRFYPADTTVATSPAGSRRWGIRRTPGTVVVEFLETIPPGQDPDAALERIAERIEAASDLLADEAIADLRARGELDKAGRPGGPEQ